MAEQICVLCGASFASGTGKEVAEGTACPSCGEARAQSTDAAARGKLLPMALYAMLATIAALSISYATITEKTDLSASVTTVTRIVIFTSSTGNMFDARGGRDVGPVVRSYSDPAAIAFGAASALLGLLAIGRALKQKNTKSTVVALAAIGIGAWKLLQGLGIV